MGQSNLPFILRNDDDDDDDDDSSQVSPEGLQEQCEKLDQVIQAMVC
jgi:hypothetical protein